MTQGLASKGGGEGKRWGRRDFILKKIGKTSLLYLLLRTPPRRDLAGL